MLSLFAHVIVSPFQFIFCLILIILLKVPSDGYFESLKIRTDMTSVYITGSVMGGEQPVGLKVDVFDNGAIVATANGMAGKEIAITIPSPKLW